MPLTHLHAHPPYLSSPVPLTHLHSQVGNSSGSSNLCLLHRELAQAREPEGFEAPPDHLMCIGIGPGLSIEALLVKRMESVHPDSEKSDQWRAESLRDLMSVSRSTLIRSSALMSRSMSVKSGTNKDWDKIPVLM